MSEDKEKANVSSEDQYDKITIPDTLENDDDFFDISESLKRQVSEEIGDSSLNKDNLNEGEPMAEAKPKKKMKHKAIKITGAIILCLLAIIIYFVGTRSGRKMLINWGSNIVADRMDNDAAEGNKDNQLFAEPTIVVDQENEIITPYRKESYVANFLICGIEEIGGGGRTDSMMIASVNIKDKTIKLTSLMRDCYVAIEGHGSNKLNAAYAFGGIDLLVDTIQKNFNIYIDGYATVNFEAFENVVNLLGGVDIELGATEANYLNTTNYISNPSYRNVKAGWNTLNGNQALGYARVRKVVTLGGANNDFGRTLRQRRLLNAIFDKYKSKNLMELVSIMYDILPEIKTNLTATQISDTLEQILENGITTIDNYRIPAEGCYTDGRNECGYVILLDFDANIDELYQIIFLDEKEPTITPTITVEESTVPAN